MNNPELLSLPMQNRRYFLMNHSSCCSADLPGCWWLHQQQQTPCLSWQRAEATRANRLSASADAHNRQVALKVNFQSRSINAVRLSFYNLTICLTYSWSSCRCCWWLICLFLPATNCCGDWFPHQPPRPPPVWLSYYHMWARHLFPCALCIPRIWLMWSLLGSILLGPFGALLHSPLNLSLSVGSLGGGSILKSRVCSTKHKHTTICCCKWSYAVTQMPQTEMRWCMVIAIGQWGRSNVSWAIH